MDEDILPKVEKLKRDRNNYLEYQKIGRDIDNLKRKLLAFDYANSQVRKKAKKPKKLLNFVKNYKFTKKTTLILCIKLVPKIYFWLKFEVKIAPKADF